ncbi:MAG: hypothetical protein M0P74_12475 [Syntrophales bacterium]|jgi:hypothetical protein|nr:hypothetical protein [Syntrophales bacterium]
MKKNKSSLHMPNPIAADQVSDPVTDQVKSFLGVPSAGDTTLSEAMKNLKMGLVEMKQPEAPRSPTQRYRLTLKGRNFLEGPGNP